MNEQEELLFLLQEEINHGNGDAIVFEPNLTIYNLQRLVQNEIKNEKER